MPRFLNARDKHVFVVDFLLSGRSPGTLAAERKIEELQALIDYVKADVPDDLAMTDSCLYVRLRRRVTELKIAGLGLNSRPRKKN